MRTILVFLFPKVHSIFQKFYFAHTFNNSRLFIVQLPINNFFVALFVQSLFIAFTFTRFPTLLILNRQHWIAVYNDSSKNLHYLQREFMQNVPVYYKNISDFLFIPTTT